MNRALWLLVLSCVTWLPACDRAREPAPKPAVTPSPSPLPARPTTAHAPETASHAASRPSPTASTTGSAASAPSGASSAANPATWQQLLALGRILANPDAPETCEDHEQPYVLVVEGGDNAQLAGLASNAGCRALEDTEGDGSSGPFPGMPLCCPPGLTSAPRLATGGAKSCARALIDHVSTAAGADPSGEPNVSLDRHGAILNNGKFLAECRVAPTTAAVICAAVDHGNVQGVSVALAPFDADAANCVAARVRTLTFPPGASMDVTITKYAPEP